VCYLVEFRCEILSSRHATFISGVTLQPISCQQYTNIVPLPVSQLAGEDTRRNLHNELVQRETRVSFGVAGCSSTAAVADTRPALQRRTEPLLSITNQTTARSSSLPLKAACSSTRQQFTHILRDQKVHNRIHNTL